MATTNDITGDKIQSKPSSQAFRDNFDMIDFGRANYRGEGAPIHPDDTDADMAEDYRADQLKAYNEHYGLDESSERDHKA